MLLLVCYLMMLLSGQVSSQEGLNGNGGSAPLLVASRGCPHTCVPLYHHSCSGSPQTCNITDKKTIRILPEKGVFS